MTGAREAWDLCVFWGWTGMDKYGRYFGLLESTTMWLVWINVYVWLIYYKLNEIRHLNDFGSTPLTRNRSYCCVTNFNQINVIYHIS